jgi:hypothetical protein
MALLQNVATFLFIVFYFGTAIGMTCYSRKKNRWHTDLVLGLAMFLIWPLFLGLFVGKAMRDYRRYGYQPNP